VGDPLNGSTHDSEITGVQLGPETLGPAKLARREKAMILYSRAKARALFYSQNFARYLAERNPGTPQKPKDLWAHYKLGRYRTVVEASLRSHHRRALIARAVSAAACDHQPLLSANLDQLRGRSLSRSQRLNTARSLAAFAPQQALSLLQPDDMGPLDVALRERLGDRDRARMQLRLLLETRGRTSDPHLELLSINLLSTSPAEQLARINRLLAHHRLEPVSTHRPEQPPAPAHVHCEQPSHHCTGPLVSVIMTTYNSLGRVENALRSLWTQTYRNIEIIVVDDCSSDGTAEHIRALISTHNNTRLLQLPVNAGPYVAKTVGLAACRGAFITCHDSDDWSHPRKIERQVRPLLNDQQLVATTSEWVRLSDTGHTYARSVYPLQRLNPSSLLFRRTAVLRAIGCWDQVRTGADSEFIARLRAAFGRRALRTIHQPLAFGAHRPGSLMTASTTGMDTGAIHSDRLQYWEAWSDWHIQSLAASQSLHLAPDTAERPFAAPGAIAVPTIIVNRCFSETHGASSAAALNAIGLEPA
jgi:hypothetical protein